MKAGSSTSTIFTEPPYLLDIDVMRYPAVLLTASSKSVTLGIMAKKRRHQPDYYFARHSTGSCRCGCLLPVTGRQIYATAACRKRTQRLLDRLESKQPQKSKNS